MSDDVVALIRKGNEFLGVSRRNNREDFGLPGGKVESGELPEQAIRRELVEETGLIPVSVVPLDFKYKSREREVQVFVVEIFGEPQQGDAGLVKWCSMEELMSGSFGEYQRQLFRFLGYLKED